jgi:glycosyltransferase involved in cell wall biosynthesis
VIHGIDAWKRHPSPLVRRSIGDVDRFISVSDVTRSRFVEWTGVPRAKIDLVPNCYDPAVFYPATASEAVRRRYGLVGHAVLLTCGRLVGTERSKGFDEVIDVLPDIVRSLPNIRYVIIGDGDDMQRLRDKAKARGVADYVIFTGYVSEAEKVDLYRAADVYVMPSRGEGFGIVFLEALACGMSAIGSAVDGSREALAQGALGRLVDPGDLEQLRDAILTSLAAKRVGTPELTSGIEQFSLAMFRSRIQALLEPSVASHV